MIVHFCSLVRCGCNRFTPAPSYLVPGCVCCSNERQEVVKEEENGMKKWRKERKRKRKKSETSSGSISEQISRKTAYHQAHNAYKALPFPRCRLLLRKRTSRGRAGKAEEA